MLETSAIHYSDFLSYDKQIHGNFFSEYATVTTVKTITTVTTYTTLSLFNSFRQPRRCEAIKDGLLISRKPQVKVFGEIELRLMKSIRE
jgi:hypothetical protein